MSAIVWTNAQVTINSVDLSDHVKTVTLTYEAEIQDDTHMSSASTRSHRAGLLNWNLDVEFFQDWAAANVDATIFPLVGAAAFTIKVRPVNGGGSPSATNPDYTGSAVVQTYPIMSGAIGAMATANVKFMSAGALTRVTS